MPSRTSVYAAAAQAKPAKGLLGFLKFSAGSNPDWSDRTTVRALGGDGRTTRGAARRPVLE